MASIFNYQYKQRTEKRIKYHREDVIRKIQTLENSTGPTGWTAYLKKGVRKEKEGGAYK